MKKFILTAFAATLCSSLWALNPVREYSVTPADYGMDYKEVIITTSDDVKLNAWVFKPAAASKKFIIVSDDGNGNMADNLELIAQFISIGYNVVAYDYRGYGKSDDFTIKNNFFIYPQFVKDITAVVDYTRKYYNTQFDMFGIGIGAGLSLSVGANRPEVRRIIADGTYSSFEQTKNKYKTVKGEDIMMPLAYDKMFMEPLYALASKGDQLYGILYIVGANEDICGQDDVKALLKLKPKISESYVVPGVKNDATFSSNKNEYFNKVKKFIDTHGS